MAGCCHRLALQPELPGEGATIPGCPQLPATPELGQWLQLASLMSEPSAGRWITYEGADPRPCRSVVRARPKSASVPKGQSCSSWSKRARTDPWGHREGFWGEVQARPGPQESWLKPCSGCRPYPTTSAQQPPAEGPSPDLPFPTIPAPLGPWPQATSLRRPAPQASQAPPHTLPPPSPCPPPEALHLPLLSQSPQPSSPSAAASPACAGFLG